MQLEKLIQTTRDSISALRERAGREKTDGAAGQLAAQRIPLESFLRDLIAANQKRLIGDLVTFQNEGVKHTGKVRELVESPDGTTFAVIGVGATCHAVDVAELQLAQENAP